MLRATGQGRNPKMTPKSPCFNCPDRSPGCHDPERCERWAEYAAACQELRDRRQDYMKTWCFESGRDRSRTQKLRNQQRHRASKNR